MLKVVALEMNIVGQVFFEQITQASREYLQSIIQDLQAVNEELMRFEGVMEDVDQAALNRLAEISTLRQTTRSSLEKGGSRVRSWRASA
jgi:hypothetical protein